MPMPSTSHDHARLLSVGGARRAVPTPPEEERRFLCGKDDLHLFAAQVRQGDTVAQAHASLKPRLVQDAETRWPGQVVRQGEWFFLPVTPEESRLIEEHRATRPEGPPAGRQRGAACRTPLRRRVGAIQEY
jgi:hypothetical protein